MERVDRAVRMFSAEGKGNQGSPPPGESEDQPLEPEDEEKSVSQGVKRRHGRPDRPEPEIEDAMDIPGLRQVVVQGTPQREKQIYHVLEDLADGNGDSYREISPDELDTALEYDRRAILKALHWLEKTGMIEKRPGERTSYVPGTNIPPGYASVFSSD